jgi:hypothetical protein
VVTPCGTQAILSFLGTLSSSPYTRKPSAKPATQPRHVASRWMRVVSLFPSLSMLEQTSKKSLPDLLISGCSGALFGEVLAGEQTKKSPSSRATRSRRTAASHHLRDSTSHSECCQQSETPVGRGTRGSACHPDRSGGISLLFDFLRSTQNRPGAPSYRHSPKGLAGRIFPLFSTDFGSSFPHTLQFPARPSSLLLQSCKAQGALCRSLREHLPTRGGIPLASERRMASGSIGVVMAGMKFPASET